MEGYSAVTPDSDSQESVFYRVETLYNTVVSVRWDNIITLWLNDRHLVKAFLTLNDWQSHIFLKSKDPMETAQFKLPYAD